MLKMSTQIENIVNAYQVLSKIPSVAGGRLTKSGSRVTAKWSVRNLDRGKPTKFQSGYVLDKNLEVICSSEFGLDVSNELLSSISPMETYRAVIREEKEGKDNKKQYLEVWRAHQLAQSIDLTALDIHGDVYADSEFGSLDWSPDEKSIVYIAEKKLVKSEAYIKRKPVKENEGKEGDGEKAVKKGEEYIYKQDWGEQLVGKHMSVVVVCQLETETFKVLEGLPESWCPGQVRFFEGGRSVVGVAWETTPQRLGLIFCTNRPAFLFRLTFDGHMYKLSKPGLSVRSPRVRPGHEGQLVYLRRTCGGPHHAAHELVLMTVKNSSTVEETVLIPSTANYLTTNNLPFYGIYSQGLPSRCWSQDGSRLLLSTPQKHQVRSYVLNVETKEIVDITNLTCKGSTSILDVQNDTVLVVCSTMKQPHQLFVGRLPPIGFADITWYRISEPIAVPEIVANATVEYLDLEHKGSTDSVKTFGAIFMAPKTEGHKMPLVLWPHGGPHSSFVNAYSLEAALFCMLGFASLQVNYRGSTGQGQSSIEFLPKRIGDADVRDCVYAAEEAVRLFAIDDTKLCLFGGSHGGFLVSHLSGQYPGKFRACVTRNPVIDIVSMYNSSDIPDWCAFESGYDFTEWGPVSDEEMAAMRQRSPITHVHKVTTPTALMLGAGDKRVPYYQGLEYYRRLVANGCKARVYMYEDNHSLSTQAAEMDNLINSAAWFFENMG